MKEGIHPNYEQTTIKCACGNVIETGSTKKDIAPSVTPSLLASRRWWILADVSAASTRSSAWTRSKLVKRARTGAGTGSFSSGTHTISLTGG